VWIQDLTGLGFSVEYPTITMHAVSRDRSSFESECLFAVLDIALEGLLYIYVSLFISLSGVNSEEFNNSLNKNLFNVYLYMSIL